jgi:hypothetical protein
MLVVVGSRHDKGASELVRRWKEQEAALLSCEDLSAPGWHYSPSDRKSSRAVVDGQIIREGDIRGVVVRRPWLVQEELTHIAPVDREFVAAEMNAFLLAWLSQLSCRVVNRPCGTSLCGPNWRPQQWTLAAASVGLQVEPTRWRVAGHAKTNVRRRPKKNRQLTQVIVVNTRCLGDVNDDLAAGAIRLAAKAGVTLLEVWFTSRKAGSRFVTAHPMPSLENSNIADAVCRYLLGS